MQLEQTFALIKSDAVARGATPHILHAICEAGFTIRRLTTLTPMSRHTAELLYAEHRDRPYFDGLIDSVTKDVGTVALLLERVNAIATWRWLIGATDPNKAEPGTLRQRFGGTELPDNAVHGSDSAENAAREPDIVFAIARPRKLGATIATVPLHDWAVIDGGDETSEGLGSIRLSYDAYGLELTARPPGKADEHRLHIEFDKKTLHIVIDHPEQDEPIATIHVDRLGCRISGTFLAGDEKARSTHRG